MIVMVSVLVSGNVDSGFDPGQFKSKRKTKLKLVSAVSPLNTQQYRQVVIDRLSWDHDTGSEMERVSIINK
jgi:hypothetical protein